MQFLSQLLFELYIDVRICAHYLYFSLYNSESRPGATSVVSKFYSYRQLGSFHKLHILGYSLCVKKIETINAKSKVIKYFSKLLKQQPAVHMAYTL